MSTLADVSRELAAVVDRLTPAEQERARRILRQQQRGFRTNEYISRTWPHLRPGHARDNPKQRWFLGLTQREVMFGGAGGGGKTEALLISALQYADIPRYSALIIGETYKDLNDADAVMSRAKQLLAGFPGAHWHASSETFTFDTKWGPDEIAWKRQDLIHNDRTKPADATDDLCREALGPPPHAMLSFGYCCHDDHPFKFKSKAYQFVGWEELTRQPTEKRYTYLFTRMRRLHGSSVPIRMRSATNPGDKGFEWVKQRFIPDDYLKAAEDERFNRIWQKRTKCEDCGGSGHIGSVQCLYCEGAGFHQRLFVPARSTDNPSLDSITYRQTLAQVTWLERQYMEHGDWSVSPSGNLFKPEWVRTFTRAGDHFRLINPDYETALPGTTSVAPFELVDAKTVTYFITADTATREKTTADFTAICSWAYDRRKHRLMLVNCIRAQVDIPDISKLILREWERLRALYGGRVQFVMIEDASSGPAVIREVQKRVTVKAFSPMCLGADRSDKVSRSATAQIMMENGEIFFPADDPHWLGPVLSELFAFNQGRHDDCVDNVAMAALWVSWQKSGSDNKPPPSSYRPGAARPIGSTHPLHHQ